MSELDLKIFQAKKRLKTLQAQASKQQRKDDTRRKVLYGDAVLKLLEDLSEENQKIWVVKLHEKITRTTDRKFLKLVGPNIERSRRSGPCTSTKRDLANSRDIS
mgnify:CR=1 FL=1